MAYDWGFQNDPNYGKRMDALLFRRAMNTAQDAADDEKRWAARFLSRSIVGIDTADGREYNGNVPMDAGTFFDKMHGFAQTYDPTTKKFDLHFLDSENQKAWDKLPDDLETRFAFAREHGNYSTVNNRLGSAAGRLASTMHVTEEERRELAEGDFEPGESMDLTSWTPPDMARKLAREIVRNGGYVESSQFQDADEAMSWAQNVESGEYEKQYRAAATRISELKALAEKRKTVREYERQLAEENSWRTVAAVSPALTDAGREILRTAMAHKDDLKNAVGDDFMRLARENPAEAEKVAAVIHALQPDVSGHTVMGDAMRAMRDTFVNTVQGAAESIGHTFERTVVGGDEYQARREREAMYRRAFSERQKDWGWWGDATIGFFGTLPYMGIAAIPYAGTAAIALSAANDFEKQVVDAGGDVSRPDFFAAKFGVGVVYAAIERAQVIHPLKGLTDFGKARMYANMFGSVSDFLKVAAHQGLRLGGEVWEEGLQGALEKGFVAWGCGQDVAAAAAKGLVQDMHGSIGAFMPLMVIEGAGTHRMYRRGGLTVDETVQATQMMRGFHDQAEITAGDAKRFGDQYGAMAVAWANAGPEAGRRSKALQARFGLNADDAAMADEVLSRLWKAVSATGDKEAVGEFFAGATLKSAADMLKATLRDAKVVPNKDGTQTVRGFIGESGHEVSFTIRRKDLALDVTSKAQAPSIVEALNGYGYEGGKFTVEAWFAKSVEERQKLAALYALGSQGYTVNRKISVKTKRALEDGTEEVVENTLDAKAIRILSGDMVLDENTLPQTVFHEAMHGLLKLAEDIAPKELMDALREAYPATTEGETVNEERIANAYRDYLAGKIPAVEYEKDIFDRLVAWIRGLLGLSDASLTIANARTSADVLFNQMLSGDFSGVVEAEKMLDVQLARVERREAGRKAESERAAERREAEKKEPAPDGGTESLGKDKFGGEIVAAEDEMVDEDGNVVPPEKMREAIAAGKIVMRREVYEAKKGEIAPNLTDEEKRRAWHLANDDYAGTDGQGRAEVPTPDGAMKVNTQLAVVDRGELITSDDPRFPQDVQNRLGRETSPQVDAIAQAPNPLWLGPAKDTADGAPLVYPWEGGYIVIAGNGRVLGLAKGDDEYKSTDAYNSYARATGERFGLNVPDTAHPRLVRVITDSLTDEQLNRLGRLSNKSGKRAEGAAGTRKSDGMAVRDNLGLVSPDMGASLRSPENSAFAFAVASDIGENGLLTSDEMGVAQSGYDRVENALLGWIVNHHEQRDAIQRALEEQGTAGHPDLGIGNILNGIKASAIHLAALAGAEGREAYDITPDIADALKDYIDFRQGGGTDMDAFLAQGDMFQNRPSLTEAIMREFFARRNSAKRVQAILDKYAETAMLQDNATPTLLDMGETAREDIWKLAVEKADAAEESQRRDSVTGSATSADTDGATADDIAEAARQYAEVYARYHNADGTPRPGWMMAPNGKPTNLTERQWVQVRTENFKRWFGDWEALAEIDAYIARLAEWFSPENLAAAQGLSREEIFAKFGNDLKPIAYIPEGYLPFLADGIADNRVYSGMGYMLDHAVNHHPEVSPTEYLGIQNIIDTADDVKIDDRNPNRNKSLLFIKNLGATGVVVVSFDEGKDGKIVLHKSFFNKMKKGRFDKMQSVNLSSEVGNPSISHAANAAPAVRLSALEDNRIKPNFLNPVNPSSVSKAVDENGEPLVVYHGDEDPSFTVFDKGKVQRGTGFWFASETEAAGYAKDGEPRAFFLNVRKLAREADLRGVLLDDYHANGGAGASWKAFVWDRGAANFLLTRNFDGIEFAGKQIAFSPSQIKSATDNVGTFSEARPDIRYSVQANPNLLRDVEAALVVRTEDNPDAKPMKRHEEIVFSRNIPFFDFLGLPNERVVTDTSRVRKMQQNHKLTPQQIATLPDHYNSPVAVMRGDDGGYHVLTDVEAPDRDGNIKPVVVYLRPTTRRDGEVVFLASAYAPDKKKESEYYTPLLGANVLFVDENKVAGLSLEEETRSILRTRASGDDVLTASDYSWWSTKNSMPQAGAEGKENLGRRDSVTGVAPAEDAAYMDAVNRGDMEAAQRMVREAAAKAGYSDDASWRMQHRAPTREDVEGGGAICLADVGTEKGDLLPPDVLENPQYYFNLDENGAWESLSALRAAVSEERRHREAGDGKHATIVMYRGVDKTKNKHESHFRNGDWITPSRSYALGEARDNPNGGRVIKSRVSVTKVFWTGDSISEFGFDNGKNLAYKDTKNNRKLLDPVTYDDAGNVIPLSERFNQKKDDIRYSIGSIYTGTAADYANRSRQGGKDDGPSLLKIGTGEGSQVYGWGLYASGVRGVAEKYAGMRPSGQADEWMIPGVDEALMSRGRQDALSALKRFRNLNEAKNRLIEVKERTGDAAKRRRAMEALRSLEKDNWTPRGSRIYEQTFFTDRAPGDESHLLKWYEDLPKEQVDWIAQEFAKEGFFVASFSGLKGWTVLDRASGKKLSVWDKRESGETYEAIARFLGSPQSASEFLARAGIDGVKYPVDSFGGKGVKDGDVAGWNYVSFRDDNIRVDHKWVDGQQRYSVTGRATPAENVEAQNAVEDAFGTTTEWNKAGYILNNGHAVDMSDGHASRTLDHREAVGVIPHDLPAYKVLPREIERWAGFLGTGAIRLIGGDITIMRDPTAEQNAALESYFSWSASRRSQLPAALASFGPSVEVLDEDGAHQDYINFDADDSTEAIVRRIHQYFEARKGDNYQSPFASFRDGRYSVVSDAARDLAEAAEPTPDDIARALERIVGTGGAQLGADLSKKENAKAFRDWIKALPKTEPPAWLRDGSPKAVFEWYEANMVGKVYSFDIPGYGHREFRPAPGHIGTLVCGGSNKGVIKKPVVGSWMEMVRNGEISGEDVSGWDYKRARMLPRIPIVLTDFDAVVHEVDRGSDVFTFIKKFDTKNGRPNTIVMKLIDDGKTIGPITTHVKDLTMSWLAKKDLILTEGGEVYGRGANNSASRTPFARDNAEGNSQALGTSISQSGAENKQIPQSAADILDGPPAGFRASVTGSAPTGKYGRNDYVVAMAAQDRLRGIDRPPRKYAELAEALGATRFKDDDGSAWVRLADELIEKNRDKLARLAERDIREAVRETARMKAEADFSEHVKKLFTGSARFGEEIGSAGTSAWLKIMRDLAARATGYDLDAMRRDTGADLLLTLMEIMPEKFAPSEDEGKAKGEGEAEEGEAGQDGEFVGPPTPQTWEEWQRNAEERRKHYNTVILLAKEWIKKRQAEIQARENARAKREAEEEARRKAEAEGAENAGADAESGTDEEGSEPEEDVGPLAIPREVIEAAGVDLQNADEFAAFMRAWICDWLVRQNPGTTYADVLDDETRLATYRRTMIAQLRDIADALLDPTEGKASIMAERMIADIRENASANELERRTSDILGFIQRNAIRQKRKGLIADLVEKIKELGLRGQKFDALERDMRRKIRGDHEQYCQDIVRYIQMSDNAVAKETAKLMEIIEGRKEQYAQAEKEYGVELNFQSDVEIHRAYEQLAALQQFGGLKNKMPSYIVAASKRLEEWLGNERMEHERRWGEFQAVCDDVAQAIEAGIKARRDKYAKKEPGLGGRMWQDVEASVRQRLEEMLVGAGPERVEAIAKVMRVLSEGSQTLEVKKMEYRRQFEKMMKTAVEGTDLDVKGLLTLLDEEIPEELNDLLDADLYDADGQLVHERQRVRMTWGQAIQLYSSLLQTATYGANIALHGRQDHARAIEEAAHPALIRLAGLMRGIYQERREELSGVVAQVTGLGIFNPDPMYMPAKMNTGVREGLDQKAYAWSPLAKSLTPRVKNRLDFDLSASVMDVFRQRSDESARAIAFGVRGMALRSMLARKSVVDAMARTHGTLPTRRLIEQVTDTLTGGYTLDEARGGIMGLVQSAGTFTTYASLSFNLVTALKQMQSVASWAPLLQGGYLELGRHIVNFDMAAARELCQAPGFVARYGETSFGRMLHAALADKEGSLVSRLARAGMTLIQIGDFVPGVLVGTGVYKARVTALLRQHPNADVAAVKDQAATETWALVEECQQTSRLEDTPHMLRRWGVMGRQVTKFATAPIQQVAHEIHTWRMWHEAARLGDKETAAEYRRKCINTAIANHVILPAAFYAVATLFGMALGDEPPEEDELFGDLLLQMLVGPFARVFFAGTIVNGLVAGGLRLAGLKPNVYPENAFPAAQTIDRLVKKGFMTASDIANADAQTVADDLLDEIGIVNAPVRYATKAARNYSGYDAKKHRREARKARKAD